MVDHMTSLTPEAIHKALGRFFPAKNDDFPSAYVEELAELRVFGITTEEQLDKLLHRRAEEIMEIDRSPMSEFDIRMHSEDSGEEFVAKRLREGFWFSYPALLRIALELEFGKAYVEYADRRDGIVEPCAAPMAAPPRSLAIRASRRGRQR
jgi:MoaA/NifB/PqqE/SkfB family radical SAM enzyme